MFDPDQTFVLEVRCMQCDNFVNKVRPLKRAALLDGLAQLETAYHSHGISTGHDDPKISIRKDKIGAKQT